MVNFIVTCDNILMVKNTFLPELAVKGIYCSAVGICIMYLACTTSVTAQCPEYYFVRPTTVEVSPGDNLQETVRSASPGTEIVLQNGTYHISSNLHITVDSITLRSGSGNPDDVVLDGNPSGGTPERANFTPEVISITASDVHLVDLTIRYARDHGIHISPPGDRPVIGCIMHNLHVYDCGQQLIKVNSNGGSGSSLFWADSGVLQGSLIEFIDNSVMQDNGDHFYTGGLDVHGGEGWTVRWNRFRNIQREGKLMEHAVHFWSRSRGTLVENNRFENVYRGIGFGMKREPEGLVRRYPDGRGEDPYFDHIDGTIRNNIIFNASGFHLESGIEIWNVTGTEAYHNTVYSADEPFSSIEYRWVDGVTVSNNLVSHSIRLRDGMQMSVISGNLSGADASLFVAAEEGNLHLSATASQVIGQAEVIDDPGVDIDGEARDNAPDIGADEYTGGGNVTTPISAFTQIYDDASDYRVYSLSGKLVPVLSYPISADNLLLISKGNSGRPRIFLKNR